MAHQGGLVPHLGRGQSVRRVTVIELDETKMIGVVTDNRDGSHVEVNLRIRSGKGPLPQVGEQWLITRETGNWSFNYCLSDDLPPTVLGTRVGVDPVVLQLFDALVNLGVVRDGTDPPPSRSDYV